MGPIDNGATIWARQTIDSEIFKDKSHVWFKIWFYLITRMHFADNGKLNRGQRQLKYEWISDATGATKHQIDMFIRWAKKSQMLTTHKTTRGMVVTICNYDYYQDLDNYKTDTETEMKPKQNRNRNDTILKKEKKEKKEKNIKPPIFPQNNDYEIEDPPTPFDMFWLWYPKKVGKGDAEKAWKKIKSPHDTLKKIRASLEWQKQSDQWTKENGQYIPNPSTYLNQKRWEDEPREAGTDRKHGKNLFLDMAYKDRNS